MRGIRASHLFYIFIGSPDHHTKDRHTSAILPSMKIAKHIPAFIGALIVLAIGFFVRLRLLNTDLSIDEIWSLRLASTMQSPFDVFTLHSDNNHYLNTLWLYTLGTTQAFWVYRIPSFFAGILLIVSVIVTGWKKHPLTGFLLGLLTAVSPILTLQSTQTRGYMPMLFCGFLSFLMMQKLIEKKTIAYAFGFALLAVISFLWQLMYIHLYLALFVWSVCTLWKKEKDKWLLFAAHLPVLFLLTFLGIVDFSKLIIGGGPAATPLQFALGGVSGLFGTPLTGIIPIMTGLALMIFLVWQTEILIRKNTPKGLAAVTLFLGSPILWMLFFHPTILYPRYILTSLFFALLLLGTVLATAIKQKNIVASSLGLLVVSAYLASNTLAQQELIKHPHDYSDAIVTLIDGANWEDTTVGSHTDFRTELLLWFYGPPVAPISTIRYLDKAARDKEMPDYWIIDTDVESAKSSITENGRIYDALTEEGAEMTKWQILKAKN